MVVDDHDLISKGTGVLLQSHGLAQKVLFASCIVDAFETVQKVSVDLIITDIMLGSESGVDLIKKLQDFRGDLDIIAVSGQWNAHIFQQVQECGAGAILSKSSGATCMQQAVEALMAGETYISPDLESYRIDTVRYELSPRQTEVLVALGEGKRNQDIAHQLGISEATVSFHLREVKKRLDVGSNRQAVAKALRLGLISA